MVDLLKHRGWLCKPANWSGTMKIIDFKGLMTDLLPYFRQYVTEDVIENLAFVESPEGFTFMLESERVQISSIDQLNKLVFGTHDVDTMCCGASKNINAFFNKVFPIPFIWGDNMNSQ